METLARILSEHPFLQGMAHEHTELIVGCASNVRFEEDAYLFHEGDEASKFYIIRAGKVALEMRVPGKEVVTIQTLSEGEVIGWSWLFPPYRWHFDARAVEETRAIALDGECLRRKCESDASLGYELLKRFSRILESRLIAMRMQMLDLYAHT